MALTACHRRNHHVPEGALARPRLGASRTRCRHDDRGWSAQWTIRAAVIAMTAAGVIGMAVPASAETVQINGSGSQREVNCEGQDVEVTGREHRVTLLGTCGTVTVQGSAHQVSLPSAERLLVYGRGHVVTASGAVGELAVAGAEHEARAEISAGPDVSRPAEVTVSGRGSTLRVRLAGATRIMVTGAEHRVLWTKAEGAPDPDGTVAGRNNVLRRDDGTH